MRVMRHQQRGFTLLEVLVTLLIFGIGMLGVAGMQITALTGLDAAQYRSVASLKASEMAERVRANPKGGYDVADADHGSCRTTHFSDVHTDAVACSAATLAADDLWDWNAELAARLPGGSGIVCRDSTPDDGTPEDDACDGGDANAPGEMTIKIWWREKARSAAAAPVKRLSISMVP
jgi:type IV pilus assembly protein PilV